MKRFLKDLICAKTFSNPTTACFEITFLNTKIFLYFDDTLEMITLNAAFLILKELLNKMLDL